MNIEIDKSDFYRIDGGNIYGSLNGKFEIGNTIKIINVGYLYTTYKTMADAMGINEKEWNLGLESIKNKIGIVVNRKVHENKDDILYAVNINKGIHIIGEKGLEQVMLKWFDDGDFMV